MVKKNKTVEISKEHLILTLNSMTKARHQHTLLMDKALMAFLWVTGARISEALAVTYDNITYGEEEGTKYVKVVLYTLKQRKKKPPERFVFVSLDEDGDVWKFMEDYMQSNVIFDLESRVFTCHRSTAWKHANRFFGGWCHTFRHTYITEQARREVTPYDVQDSVGWKTTSMLDIYRHRFGEKERVRRMLRRVRKLKVVD